MQLRDIAFKNLQRRKSKMLFLVFGMVFGIATIVTLFTLTSAMENSVSRKIQEAGIKLAVTPKTDVASFSVGGIPVVSGVAFDAKDLPADTVDKIKALTDNGKIKVIAPKVMGTVSLSGKKLLLVGVDFPSEFKVKSWWEIKGSRPELPDQALIGSRVAEKTGVTVGKTIDINNRRLTVTGILQETGEDEDGIVFADLAAARAILGKAENYSFVEVTTVKDEAVAASISGKIAAQLPGSRVKVVQEAAAARQELVDRFSRFSVVVSFVMVIIAALIITTTMMASVNERTREIGILRAIGFRRSHITKVLLLEAGVVSLASGLTGYLAGMGTAYLAAPLFSDIKLEVAWSPLVGIGVIAGAVGLGLLASMYPASKAAKLDPAESLRFI